ncbi:hypothetical protein [Methylocystis parvus]|uniref:hypothetical protein n=1 Tax=Methylocystis parvus TaxID=134 RepID=UPI003C739208
MDAIYSEVRRLFVEERLSRSEIERRMRGRVKKSLVVKMIDEILNEVRDKGGDGFLPRLPVS